MKSQLLTRRPVASRVYDANEKSSTGKAELVDAAALIGGLQPRHVDLGDLHSRVLLAVTRVAA